MDTWAVAEFDLGRLQNVTEQVDDVVLPPWAKSPYDFIFQHMQALVCLPLIYSLVQRWTMLSVLWCWLGGRKGIRPVKKVEWWGTGVVICLERGADLHTAQLMPLPVTVSCFGKIRIGFTFLVPAHPGSPGQRAAKRVSLSLNFQRFSWKPWRASGCSRKANAIWYNYILLKTD